MRKTTKNDKVIKAITIALATMITVSASPIAVLADENAEPDNDTTASGSEESSEETTSESEQSQAEETSTVAEAVEACETAEAIIEGTSEAENAPEILLTETIDEAASALAAIESSFAAPAETIGQIQAELDEAGDFVEDTKTDIAAAQTNIEAASEAQGVAETMAAATAASVETINTGIETITEENTKADENAANTEAYVQEANTAATREEAAAAAEGATAELTIMETGLEKANSAYVEAAAAADQAETEYETAKAAHDKAVEDLKKANEAVSSAQGNATAANERMKAAQAKVDALESKVNKLAENREALENLRDNYYNFMVHYYRNDAKTAVYKADGSLDLEASAAKAKADGKTNILEYDKKTMMIGRDLLKELVTLKLTLNGANADSIAFAVEGYGKDSKDASAGTLVKDNKGNARVTAEDTSKYYKQYWTNQSGDNGRNNRAKVTYTKDGVEYTEYYNYVFKASQYDDTMDLENGSIFLARVEEGTDGKWHAAADNSEFGFDNYNKLLEAIGIASAASEDINEYNKAKEAVDTAAAEVDRLQAELDKINKISVDGSVIAKLKADLDKAQADLADAKDTRDALEEKITQARALVESIDLSRFEGNEEIAEIAGDIIETVKTVEAAAAEAAPEATTEAAVTTASIAEESVTTGSTAEVSVATESTADVAAIATETSAGAAAETAELTEAVGDSETSSAVLGARVSDTSAVTEENTANEAVSDGAVQIEIETDTESEDDANVQAEMKGTKKLVKIAENEVPLADLPFENEDNISWWWLLVIALLGATGKAMYENHKRQEEAKAQNR